MATAQMLLALCAVGLTTAAPQLTLGLGRSSTGANENQVVSSVITALGPSITQAVQDALAALNANSAEAEAAAAAEAARIEEIRIEEQRQQQILIQQEERRQQQILIQQQEERRQQQIIIQQQEERRQQQILIQQQERRQQQIAAANAAAAAAALEKASFENELSSDVGPNTRPVYNFEYKVADEDAQTYISQNEERDGDELSGTYSFVDATGALVTVNYKAGVDGYSETRSSENGFVQMRAQAPWTGELAGVTGSGTTAARESTSVSGSTLGSSSGSRTSSSFGSNSGSRTSSAFGSNSGSRSGSSSNSGFSSSSTSSSLGQADLIARIIAALQPQITSAVTSALA